VDAHVTTLIERTVSEINKDEFSTTMATATRDSIAQFVEVPTTAPPPVVAAVAAAAAAVMMDLAE
jgi:hypothetical protein